MTRQRWRPAEDETLLSLWGAHGRCWADYLGGSGIQRSTNAAQHRLHTLLHPYDTEAAPRQVVDPPWPDEGLTFRNDPAARRDYGTSRRDMSRPADRAGSILRPALARAVR